MSKTVKILLAVGAGIAAVFLIAKMRGSSNPLLKGSAKPPPTASPNAATNPWAMLNAIPGLGSLLNFKTAPSPGSNAASAGAPTSTSLAAPTDWAHQDSLDGFDTANYSVNDGFAFTDASGDFVAG